MILWSLAALLGLSALTEVPATAPAADAVEGEPSGLNSTPILVRDPAVQEELKLKPEQRADVKKLMDGIDVRLWPLRDDLHKESNRSVLALLDEARSGLRDILDTRQRQRLLQIELQLQGPSGLLREAVSRALNLSPEQRQQVRAVVRELEESRRKLSQEKAAGNGQAAEASAHRLWQQSWMQARQALTPEQNRRWTALLGTPFDASRLRPAPFKAPEIRGVTAWINAEPLTLESLRGGVVALHFWAFGCSNCINNYPAYQRLQQAFDGHRLTFVGIHTPETTRERSVEAVREKAQAAGLTFPIAVDNEKENWAAWGNNVWPALYLIDKRGYVRYWWYGELNWAAAQGEAFMRERIAELLAEE